LFSSLVTKPWYLYIRVFYCKNFLKIIKEIFAHSIFWLYLCKEFNYFIMEERKVQFLLDMDGVLVDFISGALKALNRDYNRTITLEEYASKFGSWNTYDYYGISEEQFWNSIDATNDFWINLQPIPWFKDLYNDLKAMGDVTITTAPSRSNDCVLQKYNWLKKYLNLEKVDIIMCNKKYLLTAPGNILIDDSSKNVESFKSAGGRAILVPSNWNTVNLSYADVFYKIMAEYNLSYSWMA